MRGPVALGVVVVAVIATACGSASGDGATETVSPPATSTTVPGRAPDDDGVDSTDREVDDAVMAEPTTSLAEIVTGDQTTPSGGDGTPLSIEDALLPESAFQPPWELQRRQIDTVGYGAGPNQTDCAAYWEYEQLLGNGGGHAMWWIDGGNANHRVMRVADQGGMMASLLSIATIADTCPVVTWNEGGSFTTELFDLDDSIALRFVDEGASETTWIVVTAFGDLVSLLRIPLWTRADGSMVELNPDELSRLGTQMLERMEGAGPAPSPPATTEPRSTLPPATQPPVTTIDANPATTTTVEVDGLGELLPTTVEAPVGWELDEVAPYRSGGTDAALVEACAPAASMDRIELVLDWEAEYSSFASGSVFMAIGEFDSADSARGEVSDFAAMADCDFTVILPEATSTGGFVDVAGADLAANLRLDSPDLAGAAIELLVAASGPVIVVVSEELAAGVGESSLREFAASVMTKVAADQG